MNGEQTYQNIIIASAYNVQNYCKNRLCSDNCIFGKDIDTCIFNRCSPWLWELNNLTMKEGEAE